MFSFNTPFALDMVVNDYHNIMQGRIQDFPWEGPQLNIFLIL